MHYREDSGSVIYHTCAVANEQKLIHSDTKREDTFISTGFSDAIAAEKKENTGYLMKILQILYFLGDKTLHYVGMGLML